MTNLAKLFEALRGEQKIETVCDKCNLSRQTFLELRRRGKVKLSTVERLLNYFNPPRRQRLEIIRAWILAQVGRRLAGDLQVKIRVDTRNGGKVKFILP